MIIEITAPVCKCAEDETIFFSRLRGIPGYDNVVGKGLNLYLTLEIASEKEVIDALQDICNMWNTTFKVISK